EPELDEIGAVILFLDVEAGHILEHLADLPGQARRPAGHDASLRILNAHRSTPGRWGNAGGGAPLLRLPTTMEYAERGAFRPSASLAVAREPVHHATDETAGLSRSVRS